MKIFLDDDRTTPKGWERCFWPNEVIDLLSKGEVSRISLDHDLGDPIITGYDVLLWIEKTVFQNPNWDVPTIILHTQNSSARDKMWNAILSIKKLANKDFNAIYAPYNANNLYYQ